MSSRIELQAPPGFLERNWANTFEHWLHEGADELGKLEQFNVMSRTPVLTGALQSDVSYKVGNGNDSLIVEVYSDTTEQLAEWDRVYMLYQEGGALGLSTYTNGPHEMYARILTDDVDAIRTWGEFYLQVAADKIRIGEIIP